MFYAQLGIFVYDKTPDTKAPTGLEVFHRTVGHTEYKQKCPALEVFQGGTIIFY